MTDTKSAEWWRALLKKYADHVMTVEGMTFIEPTDILNSEWKDDEIAVLKAINLEVYGERYAR